MKLVTIQTKSAYNALIKKGYLIADSKCINKAKYGVPYGFIVDNMSNINNKYNAEYPLWAWVQYGGFLSPPKNKLLGFFPNDDDEIVRITFEKEDKYVLVTDYIKYHFLLTNEYLPKSLQDKEIFDKLMQTKKVAKEDLLAYVRRDKYKEFRQDKDFEHINKKIKSSYKDIFNVTTGLAQGTVWDISLADVKKVEIIKRQNCTKKSSIDYRKAYIKTLK